MRRAIFEINKSKNKKYYFVLKARNNKVIATSEMYETHQSCLNGISSVKRSCLFAKKIDKTI